MIPLCRAEGIGVIPWSPLARGFLAGNRRREDWGDDRRAPRPTTTPTSSTTPTPTSRWSTAPSRSRRAARRRPCQVALAWILAQPGVTAPIVGATRPEHLEQAVAALDLALDESERTSLEEPYTPHPILGHQ